MSMLTFDWFNAWLEEYGRAWVTGDAGSVPRLFSENARYEETPFDEPMVGLGAIKPIGGGRSSAVSERRTCFIPTVGDHGVPDHQDRV
jgi:hypothetical protein